jgi:hypothetical protein
MLFLDLDFADVARVLDDLGNVRLVSATNFASDTLSQVRESTVHPVLPENTDTITEWRKVGLNHAKGSVDGPEDEEDDEEVMRVPETLKVRTARSFGSGKSDCHQGKEHDVTAPSRTGGKIGQNEAHESQPVACGEPGEIIPVRNSVNPGEEDYGPGDQLMEGDVLVERYYVVERRTTRH